jgi:membrane dipeptidase
MIERYWQAVDAGCITPILWRSDMYAPPPKPGGLLSIEGGEPLGTDIQMLRMFFRLGVRAVGLTWNGRNALADGVSEASSRGGLTTAGRVMVSEMNKLGMLVDVSHLSEASFWDVAELSARPFIASHSNCITICEHPRNLTDKQLMALAKSGGVVGINFLPRFLSAASQASMSDIVSHIDHMLSVMGRGHVGLGSDFDGIASTPIGLEDVTQLPKLQDLLAQRFGDDIAIEIMGGSFARLLAEQLPIQPHDPTFHNLS